MHSSASVSWKAEFAVPQRPQNRTSEAIFSLHPLQSSTSVCAEPPTRRVGTEGSPCFCCSPSSCCPPSFCCSWARSLVGAGAEGAGAGAEGAGAYGGGRETSLLPSVSSLSCSSSRGVSKPMSVAQSAMRRNPVRTINERVVQRVLSEAFFFSCFVRDEDTWRAHKVMGRLVHTGLGSSSLVAHVLHYPPPPHANSFVQVALGLFFRRRVALGPLGRFRSDLGSNWLAEMHKKNCYRERGTQKCTKELRRRRRTIFNDDTLTGTLRVPSTTPPLPAS